MVKIPGIPYVQGRNSYSDRDSDKFGIAIHNTSNNATAEGEASYATRRTDGVSAHFYVDPDSVVQSLDTRARAGHAGSQEGNEHAIAVEITGVNGWSRAQWLERVAWDELARVLAVLCREYDITPRRATVAEMQRDPRVRAFYGHNDMRLAWGGTTHTDPGPNFPWDHLLTTVARALDGDLEDDMPLTEADAPLIKRAVHDTKIGQTGVTIAQVLDPLRFAPKQLKTIETTLAAVLAAQQGLDTRAILARIDEHAQAERDRDEAAAARDAELLALVRQAQSGQLAADEVVRLIGERLAPQG